MLGEVRWSLITAERLKGVQARTYEALPSGVNHV